MKSLVAAWFVVLVVTTATKVNAQSGSETPVDSKSAMISARADQSINRGLNWLAARQNDDGSFGADRLLKGNTGVCGLAGLAFLSQGSTTDRGLYSAHINRCIDYLLKHASKESGLIDNPEFQSSGPMYGHGFATLFLAEAFGMTDTGPLKPAVERAVALIVATQNEDGGWRYQPNRDDADLSVTVCQIMALRAAKNAGFMVPTRTIDRAIALVRMSQNDDGGFCYQLNGTRESGFARSAAALVGLQSAGVYSGDEIDKGIQYIFNARPASDNLDGSYYYYGHYYAVQAIWQMGGPNRDSWFHSIRDELIKLQQSDGNWASRYSPEYSTSMSLIILQIPNNVLPIFQR